MSDTVPAWIDPANAGQFELWDSAEGVFSAEQATLFEHSLHRYDDWLFRAAGIRDGDRVLDVGCGTGSTTRAAAWLAGSGTALGVDLSTPMITVAAGLAARTGADNASFLQADAQVHGFEPNSFDVIISRTGCMFFADPVAAFTNLASALEPGGRLALLVWQAPGRNRWFTHLTRALSAGRAVPIPPPDVPGLFALADPDRVADILTCAGFSVPVIQPLEEPAFFGPDAATAEQFVLGILGWLLIDLDAAHRAQALADLRATLAAHQTVEGVAFQSATWLVTSQKPLT